MRLPHREIGFDGGGHGGRIGDWARGASAVVSLLLGQKRTLGVLSIWYSQSDFSI